MVGTREALVINNGDVEDVELVVLDECSTGERPSKAR